MSADGNGFRDDENLPVLLVSNETREALLSWNRHDDEAERFCVVDGKVPGRETPCRTPLRLKVVFAPAQTRSHLTLSMLTCC